MIHYRLLCPVVSYVRYVFHTYPPNKKGMYSSRIHTLQTHALSFCIYWYDTEAEVYQAFV